MSYSGAALTGAQGKLRSFWQKPEGKLGAIVLAGLGFLGLWGFYLILPILLTIVTNTIELAVLCIALFALLYVVTNKQFRTIIKNIFQSSMRFFAGLVVEIDPIGILKNNLDDMKKDKATLDNTVERFAGSDERLQTSIQQKTDEIKTLNFQSQKADKMSVAESDPLKKERLTLQSQTYREKMGLLMQAAKQLTAMEKTTADLLLNFRHWSQISDSKIERTEMKVEILSEQRKMILDAQRTLSVGQRLLRGNPEQLQMVDMAIEYLADDTARTLGQIREFNRYSDKLLTKLDIENAADADAAAAQIGEFSQKLLTAGAQPAAVDMMTPIQGEVVSKSPVSDDYSQFLKK
jgi:hypothetical protein